MGGRSQDQFAAIIKEQNLTDTIDEDGFQRLMELHLKSFSSEFRVRVKTILEDGQKLIEAACEEFIERCSNIVKDAVR